MSTTEIILSFLTSALIVFSGLGLTYQSVIIERMKKQNKNSLLKKYDGKFFSEETIPAALRNEIKEMLSNDNISTIEETKMVNKKKILLIDDEPDILEFLSYNLKKKGHDVLTASDGQEGLSSALENKPDVIIADILMPHMNGIVMCRQIKKDIRLKNIPIIFLSAVQDDYQVLASMEAGGDHYISKPIRFDLLYTIIEDFFGKKQLQLNQ